MILIRQGGGAYTVPLGKRFILLGMGAPSGNSLLQADFGSGLADFFIGAGEQYQMWPGVPFDEGTVLAVANGSAWGYPIDA